MKAGVAPEITPPTTEPPRPEPVPCRYCGAERTTVIDRRGARVLRHCDACKLSWTEEEKEDTPRSAR